MFANRASIGVGAGGVMDENAAASTSTTHGNNNTMNTHHDVVKTPMKVVTHKTPKQQQQSTHKRRAFGDISNRKSHGGLTGTNKTAITKTPQHGSRSIVPTTTQHKKQHDQVVPRINNNTTTRKQKAVSFAVLPRTTVKAAGPAPALTGTVVDPVNAVELSAGRVWRDQVDFNDDDDLSLQEIVNERKLWESELEAFAEEERTRPMRIRQHQLALADKELEEKMEALWKQDDQDLKAYHDLDGLVLESVPSFDDLSLDSDTFGPATDYSFPDDISF